MTPPLLTLEEHYYSPSILESIGPRFAQSIDRVPGLMDKLRDVGSTRINAMNAGKVAMQVVSHGFTPGGPDPEACAAGNDDLAADISKSPDPSRFAAFAVLPISDPVESAAELERSIKQLGFVGALVDNHANATHFDGPAYDILWGKAVELDVPIYLHPTWPSEGMAGHYMLTPSGGQGNGNVHGGVSLGGPGWGWHSDVGLHVLKLFASGVFDRFPRIKIIIGHMGEMIPFMLERVIEMSERWGGWGERERGFREVWDENIWITTSGNWGIAPMRAILANTRVERVMYSVDYPFEGTEKGLKWFEELEWSGLLSEEELEMVAFRNAEDLLRLQVQRE